MMKYILVFFLCLLVLLFPGFSDARGYLELSPGECISLYGGAVKDIGSLRDSGFSERDVMVSYDEFVRNSKFDPSSPEVLVIKDLIRDVFKDPKRPLGDIYQEKVSECFLFKGRIAPRPRT